MRHQIGPFRRKFGAAHSRNGIEAEAREALQEAGRMSLNIVKKFVVHLARKRSHDSDKRKSIGIQIGLLRVVDGVSPAYSTRSWTNSYGKMGGSTASAR
jgi:hypothetical protein